MGKQFIQIGRDIINRDEIVRVAIERGYSNSRGHCDPEVRIYTREIVPGPENEGMSYSWHSSAYPLGSEEATALRDWLEPQIEVLVPYREDPPLSEGEEDI